MGTKQITVQEYKIKVDTLFQKFQKPESEYHITELWNDIRSLSINFHDAELPSEKEVLFDKIIVTKICGEDFFDTVTEEDEQDVMNYIKSKTK